MDSIAAKFSNFCTHVIDLDTFVLGKTCHFDDSSKIVGFDWDSMVVDKFDFVEL